MPPLPESRSPDSIRVLFVDDDPILGEFAKVHLATPPMTVRVAVDGSDAWEKLQNSQFDIVLLDIEMPVLDGFALLSRMRNDPRFAHVPVVMLTGREDISAIDKAFQLGANSFINKPINWRQVSYTLRYVLRSTRMEAELLNERKRSDELLQLTNNLLSLLKLEARTPLSAIIGFSDCIRLQTDGPVGAENYIRYAQEIDASARQLQDSLMDLIQFAQLSSGAATLSDDEYLAGKVLDAAVSGLSRAGGPNIEIIRPDDATYLRCDLHWLSRALRHLVEIAMNDGGVERLTLSMARNASGDVEISVVSRHDAAFDAAIPLASRPTSLETVRHQMGISLPFARRVAELHDGALVCREGGADSTMTITLPAHRVILPASGGEIVAA